MSRYHVRAEDVSPRTTQEKDGWRRTDFRILLGQHNVGSAGACMYRTVFPPGARHNKHLHAAADEVVYVIRGRGAHGQGDEEWEVRAGSSYFIPRGVPHWLRNLDPVEPVELVGVYIGVGSFEDTGYAFLGELQEWEMKVKA